MSEVIHIQLQIPGREELDLKLQVDPTGEILSAKLTAIGSFVFLSEAAEVRDSLVSKLDLVPLPNGTTPGQLLLKEALLKAKKQWQPPYQEDELCHCRMIATERVHLAILVGAHTPEKVSEQTSASTACGTCRPNVESMLNYFLKRA